MIAFSTAQWYAWIATLLYPLVRILAFVASAPFFGNTGIPMRIRLIVGVAITVGILPLVPPLPPVEPASGIGLLMIAREIAIGVGMGFAMRVIFSAINMTGEQLGFQMGIGFAVFYDPQNSAQVPVIAQLLSLLQLLVFLSINGHLMMVATLAQSFQALPISTTPVAAGAWLNLAEWGSKIFSAGLLMALPVTVALLVTNLSLGVLTRAAPQLNLFAIGFPITIIGGFTMLLASLGYLAAPLQKLFEEGLQMMLGFAG